MFRFTRTLILLIAAALALPALSAPASASDELQAFRSRIEAALSLESREERAVAFKTLYHTAGTDEQTLSFLDRAASIVARRQSPAVAFEKLPPDAELVHVLDGYRYRPNLEPVGFVVLTAADDPEGGSSRVPYALHEGRYVLPATVRRLVKADVEPDKTLQMLVMGMGHPPVTFSGWCDLLLSDDSIKRIELVDNGHGNNTFIRRGQRIEACEVVNTAGRGSLSLRLYEDDDEFFIGRVETPKTTIRYKR